MRHTLWTPRFTLRWLTLSFSVLPHENCGSRSCAHLHMLVITYVVSLGAIEFGALDSDNNLLFQRSEGGLARPTRTRDRQKRTDGRKLVKILNLRKQRVAGPILNSQRRVGPTQTQPCVSRRNERLFSLPRCVGMPTRSEAI